MFGFASPKRLKQCGIIGMNRRNVQLIAENNPRQLYPLVDNKLKTKQLCLKSGIATPDLLAVFRAQYELRSLEPTLKGLEGFVIKPAQGSGGKGILVIIDRRGDHFIRTDGSEIDSNHVHRHISNILSGLYSLGGRNDVAIVESLVQFDPCFEGMSYKGVPDIRVIVYKGYPVMAMTRLSTHSSHGKANLHQGAVGVGLSIRNGSTLRAVMRDNPVIFHPDTGKDLTKLNIPRWDDLLALSARCYEITNLGYLGVDLVLDKDLGPLLMELNARPGLAIQLANGQGLLPRINAVNAISARYDHSISERVLFSQNEFDT
ncbi:alpha-L-glutamate ligase-like protein [Oleiphilus sp. HI0009]|uniref:alpha-L-glutamate ligase-like protein n=3 Tax=unclassified Oleiphilus TaxID=2631174 RepID=UPI0007C306CD|nr:alpha-L-glutamate ligase-like protein [Oleiphilus sp. HI0125]KZX77276.1 alpha-L-glutamate ligase-like protein [Oleiphilus sp. HI0009]KZX83148.1 alpha-L-glutamate ligase-like protein [Oleiphilus sp. HI0009]KZZ59030.1 alpha-L-glutamate ligase-like protein [Oleiphilus sp. HI0125]